MVIFNALLKPHMTEAEVLSMVAQSSEFESMMVREVGVHLYLVGFNCQRMRNCLARKHKLERLQI
jgi:hypothetical protein